MDAISPVPGLAISLEKDAVVIRVEREFASPILSIMLHSKFSDGPRMEFLTSPHTNRLIEALMAAASLTDHMARRQGMTEALAPVIRFVEEWAEQQKLSADESATLLMAALYPYNAT